MELDRLVCRSPLENFIGAPDVLHLRVCVYFVQELDYPPGVVVTHLHNPLFGVTGAFLLRLSVMRNKQCSLTHFIIFDFFEDCERFQFSLRHRLGRWLNCLLTRSSLLQNFFFVCRIERVHCIDNQYRE